jgi:hypothetical protein
LNEIHDTEHLRLLSPLLRRDYLATRRTLRPNALSAVVLLIINKTPRSRDTLVAIRTRTEYLRVVGHGKRWEERVTVFLPVEIRAFLDVSLWWV